MRLARALVLLAACCSAAPRVALAAEKKPKMVVLAIKPVDESTKGVAASLTEALTTDVAGTGRFEVMNEGEMTAVLGFEQKKQLLGCSDGACLAELGGALGCDYLLVGTMGRFGSAFRLDLGIVEVRKSRSTVRLGANVPSAEALVDAGPRLLQRVLAVFDGKPDPEASAQPAASQVSKPAQASSSSSPAPFVVMGLGGAALVAGGVTAGVTIAQKSSLKYAQADLQASAGIITAGVGLAALAAGVVWYLVAPGDSPKAVGLAPMPGGGAAVCVAGRF